MEISSKPYIPNKRILQDDSSIIGIYFNDTKSIEKLRMKRKEEITSKQKDDQFFKEELRGISSVSLIPILSPRFMDSSE